MKKKVSFLTVFLLAASYLIISAERSDAAVRLYDDKLILSGFVKETVYVRTAMRNREKKYRKNYFDFARTSFYIDGLYTIKDDFDYTLRFFAGLNAWYEKSHWFDSDLNRYMPDRLKDRYRRPSNLEEDVLTEAYFDFIKGPFQLRAGKQIVIWGQLDVARVADIVNPLDFRWGVPGIEKWEEIKKGLWMLRAFYQTELPGNLLIEGIFNPGYFAAMHLPYDGTHWGAPYSEPFGARGDGIFAWTQYKWEKDSRDRRWDSSNMSWGFRVTGYTPVINMDWTFLFWDAPYFGPVFNPYRLTAFSQQYVFAALNAASTGTKINPGKSPDYRLAYFKRMRTIGGTAQHYADYFRGAIMRLEWFYNFKMPFNRGGEGRVADINDWTRKDSYGFAVSYTDKFRLPFIYDTIGRGKMLDWTLTYWWSKITGNKRDLYKSALNHRPGDSTTEGFSLFFMQMLFNARWVVTFIGQYHPRIKKYMACPTVTYSFPGSKWYVDVGYKKYGASRGYAQGTYYDKDSLILRLRYEF